MAGLDKWLYNFAKAHKVPRIKLTGYSRTISATTVTSLIEDDNGHMLLCSGTSVPSALDYFAKGCMFIKTDAAATAKAVYENTGTSDSCVFNLMGEVSPSDIPLPPAYILVGNAASVAASVALTGDMGMSNAGVITVSSQMTSKIESQVDVNVSVTDSKVTSETSRVDSAVTSSIQDYDTMSLSNLSYLASKMVSAGYVT